jgi:N-succinyl-L-ornithine transcarbamylase
LDTEFEDGAVMNASEHTCKSCGVSQYVILSLLELCWIGRQGKDNAETVMAGFKICHRTICSLMEGATGHPSQSFADAITMEEFKTTDH